MNDERISFKYKETQKNDKKQNQINEVG